MGNDMTLSQLKNITEAAQNQSTLTHFGSGLCMIWTPSH